MPRILKFSVTLLVASALSYSATAGEKGKRPAGPKPTMANVAYGKHERHKLDFWQAKSKTKTPLLIFFHGGGFRKGDKSQIQRAIPVKEFLARGISCVSVNYPFLEHMNSNYFAILNECEKALGFIVNKSNEWNLDTKRIACSGGSAGALITEWLGCKSDKLSALFVLQQPIGTERLILPQLKKGVPPLFIYQRSPLTDRVHHPKYAKMLKKACEEKGIACTLYGTGENGIPKPPDKLFGKKLEKQSGIHKALVRAFLYDTWKLQAVRK